MRARFVVVAIAASLLVGTLGTGTAAAKRRTIYAKGDVHCAGSIRSITDAWSNWLRSQVEGQPLFILKITMKGQLSCTGGTGDPAVSIKKAKVVGTYDKIGICDGFPSVARGWNFSIYWVGDGGSIAPTSIRYTNSLTDETGWSAPSPTAPIGTSLVNGSYAGFGTSTLRIASGIMARSEELCGLAKGRIKSSNRKVVIDL